MTREEILNELKKVFAPYTTNKEMLDGINEGWIDFEGGESNTLKGRVELKTVLETLAANAAAAA